jgi:hypothetical protein
LVETATRRGTYLWIAIGMIVTMVAGFYFTYFGPLARGSYPEVSPLVHVHGITFFAWYILLAAQAALVRGRQVKLHRTLGLATIALGAVMVGVGFVVSVVRVEDGTGPNADPFWAFMALPIFAIWLLFTGFYAAAIVYRHRPAEHKRFMLLASAAALSAATFRIVGFTIGTTTTLNIVGFLLPTIFVFIAMADEYRQRHRVHRVYLTGLALTYGLLALAFTLVANPGNQVQMALALVGRAVRPIY